MSELIYRVLDIDKVPIAVENALKELKELKSKNLSESETNVELACLVDRLENDIEQCKKLD